MISPLIRFGASAALAIGLFAQAVLPAAAGEVQQRLDNQHHRVQAGAYHGAISHREARRDDRRLAHITAERNRDLRRHHGRLTPFEQLRLNRELQRNSHTINRQERR